MIVMVTEKFTLTAAWPVVGEGGGRGRVSGLATAVGAAGCAVVHTCCKTTIIS